MRAIALTALLLAVAGPLHGASGFARWLDPRLGQADAVFRYEGAAFDDEVARQDVDLAMRRHEVAAVLPVHQSEQSEWLVTTRLRFMDLDTRARLLDANVDLPTELWGAEVGGSYRRAIKKGWVIGGVATVGSSSDEPFASEDELTAMVTASFTMPVGQRDRAVFFLNYSNNREFLRHVPIPGAGYLWKPSQQFQALVGTPASWLMWRPADGLSLTASYFLVRTVGAKATYAVTPGIEAFAGFNWQSWRYFRAGRNDRDDRLFYYEKRAGAGFRVKLLESLTIEAEGGYGFDRFFFEGEEYDDRDENRIRVGDGPFVGIRGELRL
jgi:hypothetical protein